MFVNRYLVALAGVTSLCAASGCSSNYGLSVGMTGDEYAAVQAYHQQVAARELDLMQARAAADAAAREQGRVDVPFVAPVPPPVQAELNTPAQPPVAVQAAPPPGQSVVTQALQAATRPSEQALETEFVSQPTRRTRPIDPMGGFSEMPSVGEGQSPMDSTGQVARVSFTEEGADFDVTTDPTGQTLLFSSTRHRETSDIYMQQVGGQAVTQLTNDPGNDMMPAFSPDGGMVAFCSDRSGDWDLYLMDAKGGPAVQLTSGPGHDIHPSFSPDGKRLVYCTFGERSGQWQLVVIDVENPAAKHYIGHGLFPQWSPTDDTIVFQRARERGTHWFSIWTVELEADNEAGSPTEVAWSPEHACITPAWSPDGSAVVFCTVDDPEADSQSSEPASSDVWLVRADGSGRTRLTTGRFANLQPTWSADNTVYFVSNRGREGVENIWALGSGDAMQVVLRQAGEEGPATADVPTESD